MPVQDLTLVLFLQERVVAGKAVSVGERLLELLTSGSTNFIQLRDSTLHTIGGMELPLPSAIVRKEFISLAIPLDERRAGTENVFFSYKKKTQCAVVAVVDGFTIRGRIHLQTAADERSVLSRDLAPFVPITNAEIWGTTEGHASVQEPIVIINSRRLTLLHVGDELD